MRTSRFWKTLDALPGFATDRRDWRRRLRDEWPAVEHLLAGTRRSATQVDCPSPAGENCPRRVVHHADGIRGVCGEPGKFCRDLDLSSDDIEILELDRRRLTADLAGALALVERARPIRGAQVHRLGIHDVHAGRGFPVFLVLSDPLSPISVAALTAVSEAPGPKVVLTPTPDSLRPDAAAHLRSIGARRLAMSDILIFRDDGKLTTVQPVEMLFAPERGAIRMMVDSADKELAWQLPPGAEWGKVAISFVSDEVINVTYGGTTRRFEPDQLGMQDNRTGKANRQWRLLRLAAHLGGWLPKEMTPAMLQQFPDFARGYDRQKQLLGQTLSRRFGIRENPLPLVDGQFRSRFVISAAGLSQGKQDQRDRIFAEPIRSRTKKSPLS